MMLIYRQLELARAKAVVKLSELVSDYEDAMNEAELNKYDVREKDVTIDLAFQRRTMYENFCKNCDLLSKQIDLLTVKETMQVKDILKVIKNIRGLHFGSGLVGFYLGDKWQSFETYTPCSSDCPVLTDAGVTLLNEWENRLDGTSHQFLHQEGYIFSLEEFFRHLLPGKDVSAFRLEGKEKTGKGKTSITGEDDDWLSREMEETDRIYIPSLFRPLPPFRHRTYLSRKAVRSFFNIILLMMIFGGVIAVGTIAFDVKSPSNHVTVGKSGLSYEDLLPKNKTKSQEKLQQEVRDLKEQVYVLQQASAKHDNYLIEMGMER